MRGITEEERLLVRELMVGQKGNLLSRLVRDHAPRIAALDRLEEIGDFIIVPYIFNLVFTRGTIARRAVEVIHNILNRTRVIDLPILEESILEHSKSYWLRTAEYPRLKPSSIRRLKRREGADALMLGIATFDSNGYVREAAIHAIDETNVPGGIAFLLIRVNDWVEEVRAAARNALDRRLTLDHAEEFAQCLPLVMRLRSCGRINHAPLIASIMTLLARPESHPVLLKQLSVKDRTVRRECLRLLLKNPAIDPLSLLERIGLEADEVDHQLIARKACLTAEGPNWMRVCMTLKDLPFARTRREVLEAAKSKHSAEARQILRDALFDRSAANQGLARRYLAMQGVALQEFASLYRSSLAVTANPLLPFALNGLAETGNVSDAETVLPLLLHERISVRRAAIRALSKLGGDRFLEVYLREIQSNSRGVAKEARNAILRFRHLVDAQVLWEIYESSNARHVRLNMIHLFNSLSKWDRSGLMLSVMAKGAEDEKQRAKANLKSCLEAFNRSFMSPTPRQIDRVRANSEILNEHLDLKKLASGFLF